MQSSVVVVIRWITCLLTICSTIRKTTSLSLFTGSAVAELADQSPNYYSLIDKTNKHFLPYETNLITDLRYARNEREFNMAIRRYLLRRNSYQEALIEYYVKNYGVPKIIENQVEEVSNTENTSSPDTDDAFETEMLKIVGVAGDDDGLRKATNDEIESDDSRDYLEIDGITQTTPKPDLQRKWSTDPVPESKSTEKLKKAWNWAATEETNKKTETKAVQENTTPSESIAQIQNEPTITTESLEEKSDQNLETNKSEDAETEKTATTNAASNLEPYPEMQISTTADSSDSDDSKSEEVSTQTETAAVSESDDNSELEDSEITENPSGLESVSAHSTQPKDSTNSDSVSDAFPTIPDTEEVPIADQTSPDLNSQIPSLISTTASEANPISPLNSADISSSAPNETSDSTPAIPSSDENDSNSPTSSSTEHLLESDTVSASQLSEEDSTTVQTTQVSKSSSETMDGAAELTSTSSAEKQESSTMQNESVTTVHPTTELDESTTSPDVSLLFDQMQSSTKETSSPTYYTTNFDSTPDVLIWDEIVSTIQKTSDQQATLPQSAEFSEFEMSPTTISYSAEISSSITHDGSETESVSSTHHDESFDENSAEYVRTHDVSETESISAIVITSGGISSIASTTTDISSTETESSSTTTQPPLPSTSSPTTELAGETSAISEYDSESNSEPSTTTTTTQPSLEPTTTIGISTETPVVTSQTLSDSETTVSDKEISSSSTQTANEPSEQPTSSTTSSELDEPSTTSTTTEKVSIGAHTKKFDSSDYQDTDEEHTGTPFSLQDDFTTDQIESEDMFELSPTDSEKESMDESNTDANDEDEYGTDYSYPESEQETTEDTETTQGFLKDDANAKLAESNYRKLARTVPTTPDLWIYPSTESSLAVPEHAKSPREMELEKRYKSIAQLLRVCREYLKQRFGTNTDQEKP